VKSLTQLTIQTPRVFKPLLPPSRYKGAHGGRGSGKSHFFAELLVERCLLDRTHAVCVREIQKSLGQSVKKLIEEKIIAMDVGHLFEAQESQIKGSNGSLITFQGMQNHTADTIKSLQGYNVAWVEEAQSLSQRSLDLLRPTIRDEGSELWFSWNPSQPTDPIDLLLRGDKLPKDAIVVQANYLDNPWLPNVLLDEMNFDRERDHDKYLHVWLGEYNNKSESRVYKNWVVEDFDRPAGTIYRLGADWGFANDPTALIRCSIDENRLYIDYEAVMVGCEIVNTPDLFRRIPESDKWFITADSSRPETISHMMNNGFNKINGSVKGAGSVADGVEFLKSFDIVVHPRCHETIRELTTYSYKTDPLTDRILPVLEDKNNHIMDALRYACEGIRNVRKKKEPKRTGYVGSGSWM
jgi:phage terminase large subunit